MSEPYADSGNRQYLGGFTPVLFRYKYIFVIFYEEFTFKIRQLKSGIEIIDNIYLTK